MAVMSPLALGKRIAGASVNAAAAPLSVLKKKKKAAGVGTALAGTLAGAAPAAKPPV